VTSLAEKWVGYQVTFFKSPDGRITSTEFLGGPTASWASRRRLRGASGLRPEYPRPGFTPPRGTLRLDGREVHWSPLVPSVERHEKGTRFFNGDTLTG
jgi:hypothetical protein